MTAMDDRSKGTPLVFPLDMSTEEVLDRIIQETKKYAVSAADTRLGASEVRYVPMDVMLVLLDKYKKTS